MIKMQRGLKKGLLKLIGTLFFTVFAASAVAAATIELQNTSMLDDTFMISIPKELRLLSADEAKAQYPFPGRPGIIYTSEDNSISLTFDYTANKTTDDKIPEYKQNWAMSYKKNFPSVEWQGDDVIQVNGKNIGYVEFLIPTIDSKKYNLIFFAEVKGRLLISNFNCNLSQMGDWQPVVKEIMNSLAVR